MAESWRLLDTGLASAARNVALERALLEARHADEIPSTLRFLRFSPSVLIGCRQSADHEADPGYCRGHGIPIQRRITGGAARFVDERQLGWELYLHRRDTGEVPTEAIAKRVGHAAATALSALGIDARYRARDEIEVDGLAVCALTHAAEGGGVLIQSILSIEPDVERSLRTLRTPALGHGERGFDAARRRMAGLNTVLGRPSDVKTVRRNFVEAFESEFDVELREGDLTLSEEERYDRARREVETAGWSSLVQGSAGDVPVLHAASQGVLAMLKLDRAAGVVREVWFTGEVPLSPGRVLFDLEAALRDVPLVRLAQRVESFFASRPAGPGGFGSDAIVALVRRAAGEPMAA